MQSIEKLCEELESHLVNHSTINFKVSKVSVGWHLHHSLMVMNGILGSLERSNPEEYRWKFSLAGIYVLTIARIPRGKGRSPETVNPKTDFDVDEVIALILKSKMKIGRLDSLTKRHNFKHPRFHDLNKRRTLKFVTIHTQHHLKIIRDILAN